MAGTWSQKWQRHLLLTEVTGDALWHRTRDRPRGSIREVPQGVGPGSQIRRLVMSKGLPPTTKLPLLGAGIEPVTTDCSESTTAPSMTRSEICRVVAEGDPTPHVRMQADVPEVVPAMIIQNNVNLIYCCLVQ